jgi:hypothetical protein
VRAPPSRAAATARPVLLATRPPWEGYSPARAHRQRRPSHAPSAVATSAITTAASVHARPSSAFVPAGNVGGPSRPEDGVLPAPDGRESRGREGVGLCGATLDCVVASPSGITTATRAPRAASAAAAPREGIVTPGAVGWNSVSGACSRVSARPPAGSDEPSASARARTDEKRTSRD